MNYALEALSTTRIPNSFSTSLWKATVERTTSDAFNVTRLLVFAAQCKDSSATKKVDCFICKKKFKLDSPILVFIGPDDYGTPSKGLKYCCPTKQCYNADPREYTGIISASFPSTCKVCFNHYPVETLLKQVDAPGTGGAAKIWVHAHGCPPTQRISNKSAMTKARMFAEAVQVYDDAEPALGKRKLAFERERTISKEDK